MFKLRLIGYTVPWTLIVAISLLAASCIRSDHWAIESFDSGVIRIRLEGKLLTAVCRSSFVSVNPLHGEHGCELAKEISEHGPGTATVRADEPGWIQIQRGQISERFEIVHDGYRAPVPLIFRQRA